MKFVAPSLALVAVATSVVPALAAKPTVYDFSVRRIDGHAVSLASYRGKVLLIVNTASKCGFTPQYDGLEKLDKGFRARGLRVLGFPGNDFMGQEPGSNREIATFCRATYGVTFDMFEKAVVKGPGQAPLYQFLTSPKTDPKFAGPITWNFNKFLIGRHGDILARFDSNVAPEAPALRQALEQALGAKQARPGR